MHLRSLLKSVILVSFVFGICAYSLKNLQAQEISNGPLSSATIESEIEALNVRGDSETFEEADSSLLDRGPADEDLEEGYIIVEPTNVYPTDLTGGRYLVPYRIRRSDWGGSVSLGYSFFDPVNYEPDPVLATFEEAYGESEMPLVELQFTVKYNFALGSFGGELGIGMYQNDSNSSFVALDSLPVTNFSSSLELIPIRPGATLVLDNLFYEPYFAPYASGGVYTMLYNEEQGATSFKGNTQVAPYFAGGALLQLDWIDKSAAREAYTAHGIENTFLFIEARKFIASSAAEDPDFETEIHANAGFRIEF